MSKAFTSEETPDEPILVRKRAPLPDGVQNYVTVRGLSQLKGELEHLQIQRRSLALDGERRRRDLQAHDAEIAQLEARLTSAVVVEVGADARDVVRFGAFVTVRNDRGETRAYQIVGVDEANVTARKVAFVSPLAQALLGKKPNETTWVASPRGEEELTVVAIDGDPSP